MNKRETIAITMASLKQVSLANAQEFLENLYDVAFCEGAAAERADVVDGLRRSARERDLDGRGVSVAADWIERGGHRSDE